MDINLDINSEWGGLDCLCGEGWEIFCGSEEVTEDVYQDQLDDLEEISQWEELEGLSSFQREEDYAVGPEAARDSCGNYCRAFP